MSCLLYSGNVYRACSTVTFICWFTLHNTRPIATTDVWRLARSLAASVVHPAYWFNDCITWLNIEIIAMSSLPIVSQSDNLKQIIILLKKWKRSKHCKYQQNLVLQTETQTSIIVDLWKTIVNCGQNLRGKANMLLFARATCEIVWTAVNCLFVFVLLLGPIFVHRHSPIE